MTPFPPVIPDAGDLLRHMEELSGMPLDALSDAAPDRAWNTGDVLHAIESETSSDKAVLGGVRYLIGVCKFDPRQVLMPLMKKADPRKIGVVTDWLCGNDPVPVDALLYMIHRGSLLDRRRLLVSLGRRAVPGDNRVTELLRRFLRFGDQYSGASACEALAEMKPAGFSEDLVYLLKKETAEPVRIAALKALLVQEKDCTILAPVLSFLAKHDRYASVREMAGAVWARLESSRPGAGQPDKRAEP